MSATHIILTQTFLDTNTLKQKVASSFFELGDFRQIEQIPEPTLIEQVWHKYLNSGQILEPDFSKKQEFREQQNSWYQVYTQPTLFFLGDLSQHSEALQEGMLKFLEEPPQNLHPILFAQDSSEILPTILSRATTINLSRNFVLKHLSPEKLDKVAKSLPPAKQFALDLIAQKKLDLPDFSKIERAEIDFWLWQISCWIEEFYKQQPLPTIANKLNKVLWSRKLNQQNLQKKLAVSWSLV
jgi:hypothetical protein